MPLSPEQIAALRPWAESETGMDFAGNRIRRLADAAEKVLARSTHGASIDGLLADSQTRGVFLEQLTAELTVGESFFFRNEHHMNALRDEVLPSILQENSDKREIRVWSAGCAGGEEPYTLAILLDQILGVGHRWHISILGTDLNPDFLARARGAEYRPWSFRLTQIHEDRNYFTLERDAYRLTPRVRDTARFNYLNLVKDVYPSPLTGTLGLDLILFRNVAIYLKPEVTRRIIERFHQSLRPGGWLLLGETEVSVAPTEGFESRRFEQATFHRKKVGPDPVIDGGGRPVLAEFVSAHSPLSDGVRPLAPSLPSIPGVPDWVPLPESPRRHNDASRPASVQWERLIKERQFDEAEKAIDRIAGRGERARWRFQLVQAMLASSELARARKVLSRCLADEPMMIEAQLLQGSFMEEAGDLEQAERVYRQALYIDRNCPMAHFHLALVQLQRGDTGGAERSALTTLKLIEGKNPHEPVEYGEGVCYGRLMEMALVMLKP